MFARGHWDESEKRRIKKELRESGMALEEVRKDPIWSYLYDNVYGIEYNGYIRPGNLFVAAKKLNEPIGEDELKSWFPKSEVENADEVIQEILDTYQSEMH